MRIAVGADHAGFALKEILARYLRERGHEVIDKGTDSDAPVDIPILPRRSARRCLAGQRSAAYSFAAAVSARRSRQINCPEFAPVCAMTRYSARQGVEHDDMNVLVLGARVIGVELARELVNAFISAQYTEEERHRRRVAKIVALETRYGKPI